MKQLLTGIGSLFIAVVLYAHPGIGIVKDSKGNIYYTDLKQVWKISPDGRKTVAVPNVHTHELYMDAQDDLYGEHLWYNGERLNTWGSYAWCLRSHGKLDTVVGPVDGFLENYSFCRDSLGNQYWAQRFAVSRIRKKAPDGTITTLAEGAFRDIRWMYATPGGVVYFIDLLDLYKIDKGGKLRLVVKGLSSRPSLFHLQSDRHSIFGIWQDNSNNIYTAVLSERAVKKITPEGRVSVLTYSLFPWAPVGGLFDDDGNLWLMEFNTLNQTRVRKVTDAELEKGPPAIKAAALNDVLPVTLAAGLLVLLGVVIVKLIQKKARAWLS